MKRYTLRFYMYVGWEMLIGIKGLFSLHRLTLQEVRREGEDIQTFVFRPRKKVRFEAGQYGLWFMPRMVWGKPYRFFTIAASPTEDTVQLSTRISKSAFKRKLAVQPIGSTVYMVGPFGRFVLGKKPPESAVLVAGGIGVTPMRALARFAYDAKVPTKLALIDSASGYYLYRKEFETYLPEHHFVTRENFAKTVESVAAKQTPGTPFYVSGPPAFVVAAEEALHKLGRRNIRKDGFVGY